MTEINIFFILVLFFYQLLTDPVESSQWRGPHRDGKFPDTHLLKQWPEHGPELLWSYEGLGEGHGNVGIGNDKIFVCGMPDSVGYLYAFDFEGKLLWKQSYGLEWYLNYTGTRSTPTVVGNLVYFESGHGVVYCFNGSSGELVWSVDLLKTFNANNIKWGMAESLLINDNKVFCTPGGAKHNLVALDRFSGKTIWTSPGNRQPAAYCSPILINQNQTRLVVTMTAESIIGIDADNGEVYWNIEQRQRNKIHANTPLYYDGKVLCTSSSDRKEKDGTVLLQLSEDGKKAEILWRNTGITNLMGGVILKDGYIYGSKYRSSEWYCLNWHSGKLQYSEKPMRNGVIVHADGLFYCYAESGEFALVDANENAFNILSKFNVPFGTKQHWAHPVIHDKKLYIRHGNALMVYDISQ